MQGKAHNTISQQDIFHAGEPSPVLPFARSYWLLPGLLLLGYVPVRPSPAATRSSLQALLQQGIRTFINLMHPDERNYDNQLIPGYESELKQEAAGMGVDVQHFRLSITDLDVPDPAHMQLILDTIDVSIAQRLPVYVHCWGGRGRTGTVAGCYLARHGMAQGERALEFVQYLRRTDAKSYCLSPETEAQRALVRSWPLGA